MRGGGKRGEKEERGREERERRVKREEIERAREGGRKGKSERVRVKDSESGGGRKGRNERQKGREGRWGSSCREGASLKERESGVEVGAGGRRVEWEIGTKGEKGEMESRHVMRSSLVPFEYLKEIEA